MNVSLRLIVCDAVGDCVCDSVPTVTVSVALSDEDVDSVGVSDKEYVPVREPE